MSARGFDGCKPRTHLAADPAYVRAGNSWAYICLPGDLANREIAGHSVGVRHDPDLVPAAFAMLRFPSGDIEVLHTDRGGEFTGERIERMLDVFGITRFLSNPGSPLRQRGGRIHQPSHQKELVYANTYTSVERLRSDLNRHVWWYNHQRLHSTLGYLSPVEFTQQGNTL
ncbi:IS3 family transposase [Bifidobacterium longum subsp. longum]|uniref:IS3 family transposase n=1 Tax=Bifidobacterium longum TaxID=216816 RepID=UPI003CFF106B